MALRGILNVITGKTKCLKSPHSETGNQLRVIANNNTIIGAKEKMGNERTTRVMNLNP